MSHRDDLHKFDAASAAIRERLQAATHSITITRDGDTFTIVCAPSLDILVQSSTDEPPQPEEQS